MTEILYLLGAGASANVLLPNEGLSKGLEKKSAIPQASHHFRVDGRLTNGIEGIDKEYYTIATELAEKMKHFGQVSRNHQSVDTYAKKLLIRGEIEEYEKLKAVLSIYFTLVQLAGKVDSRYDSFLASLIKSEGRIELPHNVGIVSWNYDSQLEYALAEFVNTDSLEEIRSILNVVESFEDSRIPSEGFFTYKINGTASTLFNQTGEAFPMLDLKERELNTDVAISMLTYYEYMVGKYKDSPKYRTGLQYCWETDDEREAEMKRLRKRLNSVRTVVVIGYSFPFFNRPIDKILFNSMDLLSDIYVQTLPNSMDDVISSLRSVLGRERLKTDPPTIHPIKSGKTSPFYLPTEL